MVRVSKEEKEFRAEDDLRTLQRAEQIKADRARMSAAQKTAEKQMRALSKVARPTMGRRRSGKS